MRTIKQYFTLGEHANIEEVFPAGLKWSYLIPNMPTSAA